MASFPGYTIVFNNRFQIDYNITITLTLDFRQQVDWLYNHILYQESPANAKGSARQPWYIVRKSPNRPPFRIVQQYQRNLYIIEKYFQCATIPSLTQWVYLQSFCRCSRSNMPTSAKFRENLNVQQFKVIQGR